MALNICATKRIDCALASASESASDSTLTPPLTNPNAVQSPKAKAIRWAQVTVYEFAIDLGESTVAERGGPSIGLARQPDFMYKTSLDELPVCPEGVNRFTPKERYQLLKKAGVSDEIILGVCRETQGILRSRKRSLVESLAQDRSRVLDPDDDQSLNREVQSDLPDQQECRMLDLVLQKAKEKANRHHTLKRSRLLRSCA